MADLNEIRRSFEMVDENTDGMVSVDEICGFLNKLGISLSEEDLRYTLRNTPLCEDQNCSDTLQFEEFVYLYQSIFNNEKEEETKDLMEAFRVFDRNEDGYISCTELQQVLSTMGLIPIDQHPQHCQKMICRFDSDCNGLLDFSEFKNMMSSSTHSSLID